MLGSPFAWFRNIWLKLHFFPLCGKPVEKVRLTISKALGGELCVSSSIIQAPRGAVFLQAGLLWAALIAVFFWRTCSLEKHGEVVASLSSCGSRRLRARSSLKAFSLGRVRTHSCPRCHHLKKRLRVS